MPPCMVLDGRSDASRVEQSYPHDQNETAYAPTIATSAYGTVQTNSRFELKHF